MSDEENAGEGSAVDQLQDDCADDESSEDVAEGGIELDHTKLSETNPLGSPITEHDETTLKVLLVDYEAAAEDARYRDRILHYTYYLAVVILGLVLNGIVTVLSLDPPKAWLLIPMGGIGTIMMTVLLMWSESFREGRDASWARRSEIEEYLKSIQPGLLLSNESVPNRLQFDSFEYKNQNIYSRWPVARVVRYFLILTIIGLLGVMGAGVCLS